MSGIREKLIKCKLYAIIGHEFEKRHGRLDVVVGKLANGGVDIIQLREKRAAKKKILNEAKIISEACKRYGLLFIVNDHPDIAKLADADGVHIGIDDVDIKKAREIVGADKILGFSATNIDEAIMGESAGADYLGVGSIFPTSTKSDAKMVSEIMLQKIMNLVSIPVFAIGGINVGNLARLIDLGVSRVAISSALLFSDDIEKTAAFFKKRLEMI